MRKRSFHTAELAALLTVMAAVRAVTHAAAVLDAIYAGPKPGLRPIHDALMKAIGAFGEFEVAPKKAFVSLRRKKQFATIGPATKTEVEIGLNSKTLKAGGKIQALPPGGMCQFRARITSAVEVDKALLAALRQAYDEAG